MSAIMAMFMRLAGLGGIVDAVLTKLPILGGAAGVLTGVAW